MKCLLLLLPIKKVPGSNLMTDYNYRRLYNFLQFLQGNVATVPSIKLLPLPSTLLTSDCSLINTSFEAMCSDRLRAWLNIL
jgi:hypothetical protein